MVASLAPFEGKRTRNWLRTFLLLSCVIVVAQSQTKLVQREPWTFAGANGAVTRCLLQADAGSDEAKVLTSIAASAGALRTRYTANGTHADTAEAIRERLGDAYTSTLVDDLAVLNELPNKPAERLRALQTVADDLAVKAAYKSDTLNDTTTEVSTHMDLTIVIGTPADSNVDIGSMDVRAMSCSRALVVGTPLRGKPTPEGRFIARGVGITPVKFMPPGCFHWWAQASGTVLQVIWQPIGQGTDRSATVTFFQKRP